MKILVFGGDGFCGWPAALHLSARGHDVTIVDNLSRRRIDRELDSQSLTPIASMDDRIAAWRDVTGTTVPFHNIDIAQDFDALTDLLATQRPHAVVHFAEQRSAPYSMLGPAEKRYTVSNNLNATHNLLAAIVSTGLDCHVVHLGSIGVYGYGTARMKIPEGYLNITAAGDSEEPVNRDILYPADPDSIYHMTKAQDQLLFTFYNKNDGVRITDLHQGIVWGTQTEETKRDIRLINRFDYDGVYGTVLNRFLMQAAIGYPLSVHGSGRQTRAFIHIRDTVRCIAHALDHAPEQGDRVSIYNQVAETHRVLDLANMVSTMTGADIEHVPSPRNEPDENELSLTNDQFFGHALQPITLDQGLMEEIRNLASTYAANCNRDKIPSTPTWRSA